MFLYHVVDMPEKAAPLVCSYCKLEFGEGTDVPRAGSSIRKCWVCGNEEFYVQKDFNRELGLVIVLASAMVVFLIMLLIDSMLGILCLLAMAILDLVVYRAIANCTVCYLCQSIYRGFPINPEHGGFYLGSEERYKKLRQAWLKKLTAEE